MRNFLGSSCLLLLAACCAVEAAYRLQERYAWTQLDFAFPTKRLKDQALQNGDYIPRNALPVGIEHWGEKLFVTVPRWRNGIPATLTYIDTSKTPSGSPELIPYPDWRSNVAGDCANGLTTAYRIKADQCGRLWVLDTGTIGIGNTTQNPCPYALNVFDLQTNSRIRRYELRAEDTNANTFIANIAIDIGKDCDDTFAYMSDELGYGLISYSWEQNKSWRFAHSYFFPDPLRGDYNIAGLNFQWGEEGIFGMALTEPKADGYRQMYFSPLASHREFTVSTKTLRDESRVEESYHDFQYLEERGNNGHTTSRVLSDDGVMLFNLIDQNSVGCWHSSLPYSPQYHGVVDRDDVGLVFPADVKIDENKDVWVISDRMPVFLIAELDYTDVNFRIYNAPLNDLIANTVCDVRSSVGYNDYPDFYQVSTGKPPAAAKQPAYNEYPEFFQVSTGKPPAAGKQPVYNDYPEFYQVSTVKPSLKQPAFAFQYQQQLPFLGYNPLTQAVTYANNKINTPITLSTPRTPVSSTPKAFIFNTNNGLSFDLSSPHDYTSARLSQLGYTPKRNWWP